MRFNITYTNYKKQQISSYFFTYRMKNEVKVSIRDCKNYKMNMVVDTTRSFVLSDSIIKYKNTDKYDNDRIYYRIDLIEQLLDRKYNNVEKKINKLCSCLFMNVLEDTENQSDGKITFLMDEEKLFSLLDRNTSIPEMTFSINIYDNIGIMNRISEY
jgi:hypothetical protein